MAAAIVSAAFTMLAGSASAATPSVRVALKYACALAQDGTVSCWGANERGQLGDGTQSSRSTPVAVKDVANAVQIDVGMYGACALIADGTVKCWGATLYGALGTAGPATETGTATTVVGISGATKISVGEATICAIVSSPVPGTVKCWGYGGAGQLGVSSPPSSTATPQTVSGLVASDISVGDFYACAVASGALKCWGTNYSNQIDTSATSTVYETPVTGGGLTSGVAAVNAAVDHTCVITTGSTVKCWGAGTLGQHGNGTTSNSATPQNTNIDPGVTALGQGDSHVCALLGDSARCWGNNYRGQLGTGSNDTYSATPVTPSGMASGVSAIDAGGHNTCAIVGKSVKCWGETDSGAIGSGFSGSSNTPADVFGIAGATAIAAGGGHSCAVASSALKCWGSNLSSELGDMTTTPSSLPVSASTFSGTVSSSAVSNGSTCAIVSGAVKCVGYGYFGQLGNNGDTSQSTAVSATVLTSGTPLIEGNNYTFCATPTTGGNLGKVYCWGYNYDSMLGQGAGQNFATLSYAKQPSLTAITSGATALAVGLRHVCAVVSSALKCWGRDNYGEVTGSSTHGEFPDIKTPGISNVIAGARTVAVSYGTTCAIVTSPSGSIKCFGSGNSGTLGNNSTADSSTPVTVTGITGATQVAGGDYSFCALVSGSVKCWGLNTNGQLGNGSNASSKVPVTVSGITNAVAISGQKETFCALVSTGGVKCWGDGSEGQLGTGVPIAATTPLTVGGLSVFLPDPIPYVKQKAAPKLKLNGKIKRKGKRISVPLKLTYAAPSGSNAATVCTGTSKLIVKTSKTKSVTLKVKFKTLPASCSFKGKMLLPRSLRGKKIKFAIKLPGNADLLSSSTSKTLRLK